VRVGRRPLRGGPPPSRPATGGRNLPEPSRCFSAGNRSRRSDHVRTSDGRRAQTANYISVKLLAMISRYTGSQPLRPRFDGCRRALLHGAQRTAAVSSCDHFIVRKSPGDTNMRRRCHCVDEQRPRYS
jgi:hypothetical protein